MATIKYFTQQDATYVEDPEGLLLGIEWQDTSRAPNTFRCILFLMDFSTLQAGREISFLYRVEVKPEAEPGFLLKEVKTLKASNDVLIEPDTPLSKIFRPRAEEPSPDAIGQLDYFVGIYLRGDIQHEGGPIPAMYGWLAEAIADNEGQTIDGAPGLLSETLEIIALLEGLGIILTLAQKLALDELIRSQPAPAASAGNGKKGLRPDVIEWLKSEGFAV